LSSGVQANPMVEGTQSRELFNYLSAAYISTVGVPGFFEPRFPPPLVMPAGSPAALSVYDAAPLKATLEELVNFDLLEDGPVRLSVGAVNIRSGNFAYFDSADPAARGRAHHGIGRAAAGLPPVVIEGEAYWDGGLVSNTPLQYILDLHRRQERQVHLPGRPVQLAGAMPQNLFDVAQREKGDPLLQPHPPQHDRFEEMESMRLAVDRLLRKLPAELRMTRRPDCSGTSSCNVAVTIVHLIHPRAATRRMRRTTSSRAFRSKSTGRRDATT
jgi:NTE family protein